MLPYGDRSRRWCERWRILPRRFRCCHWIRLKRETGSRIGVCSGSMRSGSGQTGSRICRTGFSVRAEGHKDDEGKNFGQSFCLHDFSFIFFLLFFSSKVLFLHFLKIRRQIQVAIFRLTNCKRNRERLCILIEKILNLSYVIWCVLGLFQHSGNFCVWSIVHISGLPFDHRYYLSTAPTCKSVWRLRGNSNCKHESTNALNNSMCCHRIVKRGHRVST